MRLLRDSAIIDADSGQARRFFTWIPNTQQTLLSHRTISSALIVVVIGCVIITLFTSGRQVRKNYEMIKAAGGDRFTVLFFDDHFETKSEKNHGTYEYAKLLNVIETDTDFYLEVAKGQCVIVQKDKCSAELCSFIRGLKK